MIQAEFTYGGKEMKKLVVSLVVFSMFIAASIIFAQEGHLRDDLNTCPMPFIHTEGESFIFGRSFETTGHTVPVFTFLPDRIDTDIWCEVKDGKPVPPDAAWMFYIYQGMMLPEAGAYLHYEVRVNMGVVTSIEDVTSELARMPALTGGWAMTPLNWDQVWPQFTKAPIPFLSGEDKKLYVQLPTGELGRIVFSS